jgi:hypothetical protein
MASTTFNNMGSLLGLGFKGAGKPNGIPLYNPTGIFTLGGVQSQADSAVMKYGIVVGSDPVSDDGVFTVGAATVAGVASVFTLTVTAGVGSGKDGNINIDGTVIAVTNASQGTTANLATAIRGATYARWTATGATNDNIFTAKTATVYPAPTRDFGETTATATIATTTAGTVGTVPRGIVIYRPDIAMIDTAKPGYILQGSPLTVVFWGQIWLATWAKTGAGSIDPVVGAAVFASNTDGNIQFAASGTTTMSGYTLLSGCSVKSVSLDTNGVLLMVNI